MTGWSSGSASYRGGGSLSSSSLSALAPPFKVDKSLPKHNSTNPSMNFSEAPVYGTPFDPAGSFWNSSSSVSGPNFLSTDPMVSITACPPSSSIYGYPGSQLSNSPTSVYYASPNTGNTYDPFSYEQLPNSMSSSVDEARKPFYPSYFPASPQKDTYMDSGVIGGPTYDLLSNSGAAHLSGCGSSHTDHEQGVSGSGEYKPKWGSFWSTVHDREHGNWTESREFGSKDFSLSDLSSNKGHLLVDGSKKSHPFVDGSRTMNLLGDGSIKSHLKQGSFKTQGLDSNGEGSSISHNCFDLFGGAYHLGSLGIDLQDSKSFELNSGGTSSDCPRLPFEGYPHLQEPFLKSVAKPCGTQKASASSPEEYSSQTGPYIFGSALPISTFSSDMTELPYDGNMSSAKNAIPDVKLNYMTIFGANESNTSAGHDSLYRGGPQVPLGPKCQSSVIIRQPPSDQLQEKVDSRLDNKDASVKTKFSSQEPHQFSSDGFNRKAIDDEVVYPVEKNCAGSDTYNPAEDSPCWKGASSSRLSPFGVPDAVASDVLVKKLDACRSPGDQYTQNQRFPVNTSRSIDSEEVNMTNSLERPLVSVFTSKDERDCGFVNQKSYCFDVNNGDGIQFDDDCHVSEQPQISSGLKLRDGEISSLRNMCEAGVSEKIENITSNVAESSWGVPANIGHNISSSPPGDKDSLKYCQSLRKDSDSKIDVNVLLKTMTKLSEIFRCYCFSNRATVTEQHSMTIKQIIANLNASMFMVAGQTTPMMAFFPQGASFQKESPAEMVNNAEAIAAAIKLGGISEDFLDSVSLNGEANILGDDNMTKALKTILHANLHEEGEEEMDQQKLLYKSLWLEAEAALCSMTAKARFHSMKIEMERKHDKSKAMENSSSAKVSSDVHAELAPEDNDSPALGACDHESPKSSPTSQFNHTEASVMNKFHISNSQDVSLYSMKAEGPKETGDPSLHASRPGTSADDSDSSGKTNNANDIETSVLARYQILKQRDDTSDSLNYDCKHSLEEENHLLEKDSNPDAHGNDSRGSVGVIIGPSVMARYRFPECSYSSDSLKYKVKHSSEKENRLLEKDSSYPDAHGNDACGSGGIIIGPSVMARYRFPECCYYSDSLKCEVKQSLGPENCWPEPPDKDRSFNSVGATNDREGSVMARFHIIQNRMNYLNSVKNNLSPEQAEGPEVDEASNGLRCSRQDDNAGKSGFGPYPDFSKDEGVKEFGICANEEVSTKDNGLSSEIFEGWYDDDCSALDWEHVSKEELRRQK